MLDGYSVTPPGDLVDSYSTGGETGGGAQLSLSSIAGSFLSSLAGSVAQGVNNVIDNKTRTQNAAPSPDIAAAAAKPQVTSFLNGSVGGVSLPILLIGAGALIFLAVRR